MNWGGTVTLRVGALVPCERDLACWPNYHKFEISASATTPLLAEEEKKIRERLQAQLDTVVAHFLEAHK